MPRKRLTPREMQRLRTRRERNGPDFDRLNARHAARFIPEGAKFNSTTGREAANARWKAWRENQVKKLSPKEDK